MKISEAGRSEDGVFSFDVDPSMVGEENLSVSVLTPCKTMRRTRSYGVGAIASGKYCVHKDCLIEDLVSEMNSHETLLAVGVVDDESKVIGIIIRRELFNILGRSYGDDFVHNRTAAKVARDVKRFRADANVFSVAEQIPDEIHDTAVPIHHFLLEAADGTFAGTFSTRDLLLYMSEITKKDIETATMIQQRIVPEKSVLSGAGIHAAASVQMAKGVGGDFYAMESYDTGKYFFCLADVSGKGMGASLITSILGGLVHSYDFKNGISSFIKKLNAYIHKTFDCEKYLTGVFLSIDTADGSMTVWDMGHSLLYVFRGDRLMALKSGAKNMPVGIQPVVDPEELTVRLRPGDILLLITDGVVEQCNVDREEYGLSRIASLFRDNEGKSVEDLRDLAAADITSFRGSETQHDDISFLLARFDG